MTNISDAIRLLPETVQPDILDLHECVLKDGQEAVRVTLTRFLTEEESSQMQNGHFIGLGCIATYRYAPEIQKSYFYVV